MNRLNYQRKFSTISQAVQIGFSYGGTVGMNSDALAIMVDVEDGKIYELKFNEFRLYNFFELLKR